MQNGEIVKLTKKRIAAILMTRRGMAPLPENHAGDERRRAARWPFNGAVELWPDGAEGRSTLHATCLNMSEAGIGISCEQQLNIGDKLEVAVHVPEMTVCGKAIVRYCAPVRGEYMIGMEFEF